MQVEDARAVLSASKTIMGLMKENDLRMVQALIGTQAQFDQMRAAATEAGWSELQCGVMLGLLVMRAESRIADVDFPGLLVRTIGVADEVS
jgi:hypothetical protein